MNVDIKNTLSNSQLEIFERWVVLGESKKEIANNTNRSIHTVQTTLKTIYDKLGISKATEAVLLYCSQTFNIAEQVKNKQMEILNRNAKEITAICLLIVCTFDLVAFPQNTVYRRSLRSRRKQETEIIVTKSNISA